MNDLISKSEVLELLYKIFDKYYMSTDKNPSIISKSFGTESFGIDVFKEIKKMPTAYSVDNVVEELELHSFELGTDTLPVHYVRLNEAIEIVKQGSASDDACEWKAGKSNYEWQPNCEPNSTYNVFGVAWFKRCPYCGKKIKTVGD